MFFSLPIYSGLSKVFIFIFAPMCSNRFAYRFNACKQTTRESSARTVPPDVTDRASRVLRVSLSTSPVVLLVQKKGALFFKISAFLPVPNGS